MESAAAVVVCELPSDICGREEAQTRKILAKAVRYAGNPVINRYGIEMARSKITCTMNPAPSVIYEWDVQRDKALEAAEYTRQTWRELMDTIRQIGTAAFLAD